MKYYAKKGQMDFGESIGVIMLDTFTPFIPGDVGNANTFSFPVRYEKVEGLTVQKMMKEDDLYYESLLEAGNKLARHGVKAITGDCGYMAIFQEKLVDDLKIPVFLTSLLQLHFLKHLIGKKEKIGVITANSNLLDQRLLQTIGIDESFPIVIKGLEKEKHFHDFAIKESGFLYKQKVEEEVVHVAEKFVTEHPSMKMILLECSMLPPYAKALQDKVKLPVYDYASMINYVQSGLVQSVY
ncbi:Asp/Glu/hydantoin racemase [Salirhabdus euzebyi]|uniref:Asp/Glu/hydantoin racemase n=1 Tax=Salirhabdus euzebyi TaxID=394506 RepID=A0A841PWU1_9BACI|nr:aspartate/glutamate racemase family protein [Salirhabdus euzebyi]MBB6452394.1 Asp/Glu/hydantoin racemase [Salirhabdus euzebyi]